MDSRGNGREDLKRANIERSFNGCFCKDNERNECEPEVVNTACLCANGDDLRGMETTHMFRERGETMT